MEHFVFLHIDIRGKLCANLGPNHLPCQGKTPEKLWNCLQRTIHIRLKTFKPLKYSGVYTVEKVAHLACQKGDDKHQNNLKINVIPGCNMILFSKP